MFSSSHLSSSLRKQRSIIKKNHFHAKTPSAFMLEREEQATAATTEVEGEECMQKQAEEIKS